jgi:hypothetical protein
VGLVAAERVQFKKVGGHVLFLGPYMAGIELDSHEIACVLINTISDSTAVPAVRVENRDGGVNRNRVFDLDTGTARGDVLEGGELPPLDSRVVRPEYVDQLRAKIALSASVPVFAHAVTIGIFARRDYSDRHDHAPASGGDTCV